MSRAEMARQQLLANPNAVRALTQQNPAIASALSDPAQFEPLLEEQQRQAMSDMESADMFDIEGQRRIEEEIRRSNIAQNMEVVASSWRFIRGHD
ncbi:hypothetical protein BC831DRAFT_106564 [Entophlyctis helioformis]|nr:hypothetical protein BC831DRAFT_106564 [Entophlyctis helioformis]